MLHEKKFSETTLWERYGLKEEEFEKLSKEVAAVVFGYNKDEGRIVDLLFPEMDAKTRVAILIYGKNYFSRQLLDHALGQFYGR